VISVALPPFVQSGADVSLIRAPPLDWLHSLKDLERSNALREYATLA